MRISPPKPYWFDEYGANRPDESVRRMPDYGCYLAQAQAAFINGGCQTSLIWILIDQQYPGHVTNSDSFYDGIQRWGLIPWPRDDQPDPFTPYPAWYAYGLMSRVLGGGVGTRSLRTQCGEDVYIAAVEQPGGAYAFLVVNAAHEPRSFTVQLSAVLDTTLERYEYDPALVEPTPDGILPVCGRVLSVSDGWSDTLPSRGVALYRTRG